MDVTRASNTGLAPASSPIPKPRPQQQNLTTPVAQNLGNSNSSNRCIWLTRERLTLLNPNRLSFSPAAKAQATAQVTSSNF
jgi:hypothetical protein